MDKALLKIPLNGRFTNYSILSKKLREPRYNLIDFDFYKEQRKLSKGSSGIKFTKLKKSLTHSDLGGHILSEGKKITAIID